MKTPRENILSCLKRQGYEYVPIDMELCDSQRKTFREKYGHDDYPSHFRLCHRGFWAGFSRAATDWRSIYRRESLPASTSFDDWGVGHSKGSESAFHMTRMHHPLRGLISREEVDSYPFPRYDDKAAAVLAQWVGTMRGQGLATVGGMSCTIWETAWYIRSMEDLMTDMMTGDEKAALLLDKVTNISCDRAAGYARAGVDILHLGDDIGTQSAAMMSVELWREWIRPRLKRVIDAARAINPGILVFYHSCGFVKPFIGDLIETGVDILNPVQPESMDFDEVHAEFGDRLSFWGTVGTQTTMPYGTPADVRRVVESRLKTCGEKGGIVIGPTHLVEPEVPWENIEALVEAAAKGSN